MKINRELFMPHRPYYTYVDAAFCYRASSVVCRSVCLSVCHTSEPCKTAEPIKMPFWLRTRVGQRNHVLDGDPDCPMGRSSFAGRVAFHCKVERYSSVISTKTAEPIEMPLRLRTRVSRRKHKFNCCQVRVAPTCPY